MNPRTLRLVAGVYVVKTLLAGIAWWAVPDLPERLRARAEAAWSQFAGQPDASLSR